MHRCLKKCLLFDIGLWEKDVFRFFFMSANIPDAINSDDFIVPVVSR